MNSAPHAAPTAPAAPTARMPVWAAGCLLLVCSAWCVAAQAQSLQCAAGSVGVGDSAAVVSSRCGAPAASGSYCAPVEVSMAQRPYANGNVQRYAVPCQPVEEWVYDRGPGNLPARLLFRGGVLRTLVFGQQTQ